MTTDPAPSDLTISEVAAQLNCADKTVRNLIERGELTAIKYGQRFVRVEQSALDDFKARHRTPLAAERAEILGPETVAAIAESAAAAPPLTEDQQDTIRSAFRAPAPPKPVRAPYTPQSQKGAGHAPF